MKMNEITRLRLIIILLSILILSMFFLYIQERGNFFDLLDKYCKERNGEAFRTLKEAGCITDAPEISIGR